MDNSALLYERGDAEAEIAERLEALGDWERSAFDRVLMTLGKSAQTALPGVIKGASAGAAAGPWGAVVGGLAGGAVGVASHHLKPKRGAQPAPSTGAPVAQPSPGAYPPGGMAAPAAPARPAGSDRAAAELLALVQDPGFLATIAALVAGPAFRDAPGTPPPPAYLNALNVLSQRAAAGMEAGSYEMTENDDYLRGADGEYAWDAPNPESRADALLDQLRAAAPQAESIETEAIETEAEDSPGAWLLRAGAAHPLR